MANSVIGLIDCKDKNSLSTEIRPKVTFITASMNLGGAEKQLLLLCNSLKDEVAIEIISLDVHGPLLERYQSDFPNISMVDSTKHSKFTIVLKLRKLIKRNHPDVVITWLYKADILGGIATKLTGKMPVIWSARNSAIPDFTYFKKLILVLLSGVIPTFIVANGQPASKFHKSIGYPSDKIKVIPNLLSPWTSKAKSKSKLLIAKRPLSELRIGIASRQVAGKGILETFKNISMLPPDFIRIELSLIGQQSSESETWKLSGIYSNYQVEAKISDSEIAEWFEGLDIYLMPSTSWESQPNSLFEAIAIGCPILFSNMFELDQRLSSAHSFNPLNPVDFQRAIQEKLGQSSDNIIESAEELRKYISNLTDARHVGSTWVDLIKTLSRKG